MDKLLEPLAGQMESLLADVRALAENTALLHGTGKTLDRKAMVIGQALVAQKETLARIAERQERTEKEEQRIKDGAKKKVELIEGQLRGLIAKTDGADSLKERENALLSSLADLSEDQKAFLSGTETFAKQMGESLQEINGILRGIGQAVESIRITEQMDAVRGRIGELETKLDTYLEHRRTVGDAICKGQERAEARIRAMQDDMEKQRMAVEVILRVASACEEKTAALCGTLETMIEERQEPTEEITLSLEDVFLPTVVEQEKSAEDPVKEPVSELPKETGRKRRFLFGRK